jgi:hypothetical protein
MKLEDVNPWVPLPYVLGTDVTTVEDVLKVLWNPMTRMIAVKGIVNTPASPTAGFVLMTVDFSSIPADAMANYASHSGLALTHIDVTTTSRRAQVLTVLRPTGVMYVYSSIELTSTAPPAGRLRFNYTICLG